MKQNLTVLLPGRTSPQFRRVIREVTAGYAVQMVTRSKDIPLLKSKKVLWAIELSEYGFNLSLEEMLQEISQRGNSAFENSQGAIIIQSPVELWTKYVAHRLILQTNQLGCRYMGQPVVERLPHLVNFSTWQKQLKIPLSEIFRKKCSFLVQRLMKSSKPDFHEPAILVLYSNPRKGSNTMMLWQMVKKSIAYNHEKLVEQHVENGTIVDCRGCSYTACKHYSERKSCFYGGIMVQEILPAIEQANCLIWLCPNYNDAVSAKLMAVINRLTVLYKRVNFYRKTFFAIIVSGNSGSENVAMQLIGALNVNKGFQLPPYFSLNAIANDPGEVKKISHIQERALNFARHICQEIDISCVK